MWAGADNQGNFLGRISIRRNQVASMESDVEDLELFQKKIGDRFLDLLSPSKEINQAHAPQSVESGTPRATETGGGDGGEWTPMGGADSGDALLSIAWLRKLLDAFLCCEAEFKAVLLMGREPSQIVKSPLDKLIPDMLDRAVKALDICNAITHGVEAVRFMQSQAQIVVSALEQRPFTDAQIRRARRALAAVLASIVVDEKEGGKSTERSRSFGRRASGGASAKDRHHAPSFRSLSWSVAKHWSAAKQVQALSSNLYAPRGGESTGLAVIVHIMSVVLVFVMWALVAAIPCQERAGLGTHIPVPKQSNWAQGMCGLQEKIAEEWKRKEKKGSAGLMEELVKVEKLAQSLVDFADNFQYPMEEEKEAEVAAKVADLAETCQRMEDGLGPLQQQIREVFHRLVRSRAVVLEAVDHAGKATAPNA